MVPKSGHVTITRVEKLHKKAHIEKFTDSKNATLFYIRRKITKLSPKNRFRTVASLGACGHLAVLNWLSLSIHVSSSTWINTCTKSVVGSN